MAFFPLVSVLHQSTGLIGALLAFLGLFFAFNLSIKITLANFTFRNLSFMMLFLFYYFASSFFSRSIAEALGDYNVILIPMSRIAFFIIFINVKSKTLFYNIIHTFLIAASIESLIGLSQVLFEFPVPGILERGLYREPRNYFAYVLPFFSKETVLASGSFEHFNGLAGYLILALPIAFGCWLNHKRKIYFLATAIIFSGIICTFSRGALLSSIIVLLFLYFSFNKNKKLIRLLIFGGIVFFLVAFSNINNYVEDTGNTTSRYLTWLVALEHAFAQPLRLIAGFGLFYFRDHVLIGVLGNLHSSFLQIFLEMGLIGTYLYFKAMQKVVQTMKSQKSIMNYTLIAIVIGFTASQLVDNSLFGFTGTIFISLIALFLSQADLPINKIIFSKPTTSNN
jgi:hypothetical protein